MPLQTHQLIIQVSINNATSKVELADPGVGVVNMFNHFFTVKSIFKFPTVSEVSGFSTILSISMPANPTEHTGVKYQRFV